MTLLALQPITKTGGVTLAAATAGGDTFSSDPRNTVIAQNAHASVARTITITPVNDPLKTSEAGSIDLPDISIVVAALGVPQIFHVPSAYASNGIVSMTYDDEADLTIGVGVNG